MAVSSIQGKGNIRVYAVTLGTVFILATYHRALQDKGLLFCSGIGADGGRVFAQISDFVTLILRKRNNGNATLIAGRITSVAVKSPGSFSFVNPAVRIIRFHGIGVLGADAVGL